MPWNLPDPPSGITGPTRDYLLTLKNAINQIPVFSWASLATPESVWTGHAGDFFVNLGSASTNSRLFFKVAPVAVNTASKISWITLRIL